MKAKMKYPMGNNPNFDGRMHDIETLKLMQANNSNFYILEYYDYSLNKRMETFLKKEGDSYFKVPLRDYTMMRLSKVFFKDKCKLELLPNIIQCTSITTLGNVLKEINNSKKNNIRMATQKQMKIYYNRYDEKYYWDEVCLYEIVGAPESLGTLSIDGHSIISGDIEYKICSVYVNKNNYDNFETKNTKEKPNINKSYKRKIMIFYNTHNNKYYWDENCSKEIIGGIESLGRLSSDGYTVIGGDTDYSIKYVYSILLKNNNQPKKQSEEVFNYEGRTVYTKEFVLHDIEKNVFYYSEYLKAAYGGSEEPFTHRKDMPQDVVTIQYILFGSSKNESWSQGKFVRIPEIDITEELREELLKKCNKATTKMVGKKDILNVKILKDQDGNKYIRADGMKDSKKFDVFEITLNNDKVVPVMKYSTEIRLLIERIFPQLELIYEEQPIYVTKQNDLDNSNKRRK